MKSAVTVIGCLLFGITAPLPAQEGKFATVNVARVLEDYTPYQEEFRRAKEKFATDQRERAGRETRDQELVKQWEELKKQADDKSLSKKERQKADEAAAALVPEIKELERSMSRRGGRDWGTPQENFDEQLARRRKLMLDEVQEAVTTVADREQCQFVFDTSRRDGEGGGGGLLWVNPTKFPDLSPAVLAELKRLNEMKLIYATVNDAAFLFQCDLVFGERSRNMIRRVAGEC